MMWDELMDKTLDTRRIKVGKPRGKHPDKRLTAVRVRSIRTPGRIADGNGLYLFVDESGAKRWVWRGHCPDGKRNDVGLGSVRIVSLAEARDHAAQLRRDVRAGKNPLAERRRERQAVLTFKEAAEKVHAAHADIRTKSTRHNGSRHSKRMSFPGSAIYR